MTFATAEKYFMQPKFCEWKLVNGEERTFVVGGFMNGRRLPLLSEESWTVIDRVPLQMRETNPTHGCKANDLEFWRSQEKACQIQCGASASVQPFRPAVDQAVEMESLRSIESAEASASKSLAKTPSSHPPRRSPTHRVWSPLRATRSSGWIPIS